jgi:hypothetical protein
VLSLRVSRDKRGYDHIYLLLETRRKGRTVTRLLYGGRWPSPMKIGQQPLDEATRKTLEQAYPEVTFDWVALQRTLQQALATPRAPMTPETRRRRAGEGGRPSSGPGGQGQGQGGQSGLGGQGGRPQHGAGRMPPSSRSQQMPPRQRPPYAAGGAGFDQPAFGDQGEWRRSYDRPDSRDPRDVHEAHEAHDPHELRDDRSGLDDELRQRELDDTADLPFGAIGGMELDTDTDSGAYTDPGTDTDITGLPVRPYDEPILEEGLETEPRRGGGLSDIPAGPDEIEPVEERTFVVSSGDDDPETGDPVLAADELVDDRLDRLERLDRIEAGPGFTRDEFPVIPPDRSDIEQGGPDRPREAASGFTPGGAPGQADPSAPPRRRRRRRRGGRRAHGGPNAESQAGGGPSPEGVDGPDHADSEPDGPDGHDDDSDV